MKPLYLVDASIYIFRAWFSMPDAFFSRAGRSVNAVYGYTNFLLDLLDHGPEYISFAFDESLTTCFRNQIYPAYKANRELPDQNLTFQLQKCQEVTDLLGLHNLALVDFEADDIIGTLMALLAKRRPVVIVTRDKDLGQLLRKQDLLWDYAAGEHAGPQQVADRFGVQAEQMADFLALAGDSVDNIPGAPGIGAKTAATLLRHFGSLEELFARHDEIAGLDIRGAARIQGILADHEADIRMYRQITGIKCDIPIDVTLAEVKPGQPSMRGLEEFCDEMAFGGRIRERIHKVAA